MIALTHHGNGVGPGGKSAPPGFPVWRYRRIRFVPDLCVQVAGTNPL
jgi:hypothetical protein